MTKRKPNASNEPTSDALAANYGDALAFNDGDHNDPLSLTTAVLRHSPVAHITELAAPGRTTAYKPGASNVVKSIHALRMR